MKMKFVLAAFLVAGAMSLGLMANASSGVSTRTGSDFDTVGVVGQYRWGAGL